MVDGCVVDDEEVNRIIAYTICAKEFHFTPEQVDNIDRSLIEGMLVANSRIKERQNEEKR